MTVEELYDKITKNTTPEHALMNLLKVHLVEYNKMKYDDNDNEIHPIIIISTACLELNWNMVVINTDNDNDELNAMIIGNENFINTVLQNTNSTACDPNRDPVSNNESDCINDCNCNNCGCF